MFHLQAPYEYIDIFETCENYRRMLNLAEMISLWSLYVEFMLIRFYTGIRLIEANVCNLIS